MSRIVQKYGGSSVADAEAVRRVAARIVATKKAGHEVVVVVSAMGDTTDDLMDLANRVSPEPASRELDMLLTAGERISMALLAMAIHDLGEEGRSYTGSQAGLITDAIHGAARILDVTPGRIATALSEGAIPIVAGFQGVSSTSKDVTTLGRGGSDTTAVALAAALDADVCEIYTDVDGVFSSDPRVVPSARQLRSVSYEEMLELAAAGAKVLHLRCVEYARRSHIPIHVRSSFSAKPGTWVIDNDAAVPQIAGTPQEASVEQPIIAGVAHDLKDCKITVVGVPDRPGKAAAIFEAIAGAGVNVDMIVQNASLADGGSTEVSFTCSIDSRQHALDALEAVKTEIGFTQLVSTEAIAKISLVGAGMRSHPGVSATLFQALADADINISMITTSEIRISVVTDPEAAERAVRAIHTAFGLDAEGEAIVYGGTGR